MVTIMYNGNIIKTEDVEEEGDFMVLRWRDQTLYVPKAEYHPE